MELHQPENRGDSPLPSRGRRTCERFPRGKKRVSSVPRFFPIPTTTRCSTHCAASSIRWFASRNRSRYRAPVHSRVFPAMPFMIPPGIGPTKREYGYGFRLPSAVIGHARSSRSGCRRATSNAGAARLPKNVLRSTRDHPRPILRRSVSEPSGLVFCRQAQRTGYRTPLTSISAFSLSPCHSAPFGSGRCACRILPGNG
jgi:hypothetical protein